MVRTSSPLTRPTSSRLDRALSLVTDVRPGEGATALLMLLNIFLLLVCYSVVKTVREPLILLGGGAEVRSYAAAGQALVLIGFVPLYSAFAARVSRAKLLIGVTLFFIAGLELFTLAVTARLPYVGVAFFIWVGIFNVSLIAQFWSFANDLYTKDAGARLFPIVVIGMTAGAPIGSFIAARLFHAAFAPQVILQIAAALLAQPLLYVGSTPGRHRAPAPRCRPAEDSGSCSAAATCVDRAAGRPAQRGQYNRRAWSPGFSPPRQGWPGGPLSTSRPTSAPSRAITSSG